MPNAARFPDRRLNSEDVIRQKGMKGIEILKFDCRRLQQQDPEATGTDTSRPDSRSEVSGIGWRFNSPKWLWSRVFGHRFSTAMTASPDKVCPAGV
jgi:hypothetical protein